MQTSAPKHKTKHPYATAIAAAREVLGHIQPFCERAEIAGSIRRQRPFVGDIELVYIPKMALEQIDLLTTALRPQVDPVLEQLVRDGVIEHRKNVNGSEMWGEKNKYAVHVATGIPVDFFSTNEANWWTYLVIRTGGQQNNIQLATGAKQLKRKLNPYGCGVTDLWTGREIRAESEEMLFSLCGQRYLPPNLRL